MDATWIWIAFNLFVVGMLALDLGVFHRQAHAVSVKEATWWSVAWISLALVFNATRQRHTRALRRRQLLAQRR